MPIDHPLQILHPRSLRFLSDRLQDLVRRRLRLKVLIGMMLGIGIGITLGPSVGWPAPEDSISLGRWLALPGQVFLGMIQMIVVPLIFASIIRGLAASEDLEQLRRVGLRTVLFFVVSTTIAIIIGIGLALVVLTAVAASIGSPATPGVGIVILAMVLESAGIPAAGIGLIIGVDRILDMSRTAVNVTGDIVAAILIDRFAPGRSTAEEQHSAESVREKHRAQGGHDVIIAGDNASLGA